MYFLMILQQAFHCYWQDIYSEVAIKSYVLQHHSTKNYRGAIRKSGCPDAFRQHVLRVLNCQYFIVWCAVEYGVRVRVVRARCEVVASKLPEGIIGDHGIFQHCLLPLSFDGSPMVFVGANHILQVRRACLLMLQWHHVA